MPADRDPATVRRPRQALPASRQRDRPRRLEMTRSTAARRAAVADCASARAATRDRRVLGQARHRTDSRRPQQHATSARIRAEGSERSRWTPQSRARHSTRARRRRPSRRKGKDVTDDGWKRYPYVPDWGDPAWFTLPDCRRPPARPRRRDVLRRRLPARAHQRAIVRVHDHLHRHARRCGSCVRASFYTFALYDLDRRHYGTYTDYDFPRPPRIRRRYKLARDAGSPRAPLRRAGRRRRAGTQRARRARRARAVRVGRSTLPGIDHHGDRMPLELDDRRRPAARAARRPRARAAR